MVGQNSLMTHEQCGLWNQQFELSFDFYDCDF
jgi:hypothetical protein